MKKVLLATAILAGSTFATTASANMDFSILGGYDSDSLLTFGAELGYNDVIFGLQSYGSQTSSIGVAEESYSDWGLYGGYRLPNGLALKAGAVLSDISITGQEGKVTYKGEETLFRPFIGAGFGTGNWTLNLHYALGAETTIKPKGSDGSVSKKGQLVSYEGNWSLMAGYRF
ncbi:hypothetical protein [Vibrio sp. SCSIO 43136]|uniref:hypothetical protein n=1 Tax=Vibrio sp. SCSIO 43136 TaxID=2819101 RepID=UPI0020763BCD|nr:hypothetical protein [Vibrio sp. SCSIO 43136]USD66915.1 hypothetical protein J4N39_19915 [Vibrio sp. SCSIO 43136]